MKFRPTAPRLRKSEAGLQRIPRGTVMLMVSEADVHRELIDHVEAIRLIYMLISCFVGITWHNPHDEVMHIYINKSLFLC